MKIQSKFWINQFTRCIKKPESCFFNPKFFFKNDPIRPNFMRVIDYAHSHSLKTLPWTDSGYWSENMKILDFSSENHHSWIFYARNRLCVFPKLENDSLTLIQGNNFVYWIENRKHTYFLELGSEKRFQASRILAIDFSHKITPGTIIFRRKIQNFYIFASIHKLISLN
jgi:hypothetical protein